MLRELYIENFVLIEKSHLFIGNGLNVFTGETGTGKSILVDAVNLLLGSRASGDYIRNEAEKARVEGVFSLPAGETTDMISELGFDVREDIWLAREISRDGKNTCRINGRPVNLSVFRKIGHSLIDIYGQHEHQSLNFSAKQLGILDAFGGKDLVKMCSDVQEIYQKLKFLENEKQLLEKMKNEKFQREEILTYQLEEIDAAHLKEDEEEELLIRKKRLSSTEKLFTGIAAIIENIFAGSYRQKPACDLLSISVKDLKELSEIDEDLTETCMALESSLYQVEDVAHELQNYRQRLEHNPQVLEEIEDRLGLIQGLKRKYGKTIKEVLVYRERIANEWQEIQNSEKKLQEINKMLEAQKEKYQQEALKLSEKRQEIGKFLEEEISSCLQKLHMPYARMEIKFIIQEQPTAYGNERVEFLFSSNPGELPKPISKIASGGELSRFMLALKSSFAQVDSIPTLIFDEIDAGMGGHAAYAVAHKLKRIGKFRQVICVTHLPQIASFGDHHFNISKKIDQERTLTQIKYLKEEERIEELTRMLGGETKIAQKHAEEMLARAQLVSKTEL